MRRGGEVARVASILKHTLCSCSCTCTCQSQKISSSFALLCSLILTVEESVSHRLHLNDYRLHPMLVVRVASIRKQCQRLSKIHCWDKAKAVKTNHLCSEDQLYREGREQGIWGCSHITSAAGGGGGGMANADHC